jgi:hypothetical protein
MQLDNLIPPEGSRQRVATACGGCGQTPREGVGGRRWVVGLPSGRRCHELVQEDGGAHIAGLRTLSLTLSVVSVVFAQCVCGRVSAASGGVASEHSPQWH